MKCCVTGCKNESRRSSKSQGITFHVIPTEPTLRSSWLQALNKQEWELKEWSVVCSDHFFDKDLYYTKNGLRKLRTGAVPKMISIEDMSSGEFGEPASLKVCRICLAMDSKLYSIYKYKLEDSYKQLTGVSLSRTDSLPLALCYECAHRLVLCASFRSKSLRANALLNQLMSTVDQLSQNSIKSIDRESNQLTSPLQAKTYEPNHCDIYIDSTDIHTDKPTITEVNVDNVDIKNETDFISEDVPEEPVKEEPCDEETFDEEPTHEESRGEESDQNEKVGVEDDEMRYDDLIEGDKDFAASEDDFSSDDSLPLEISRTKKKKKPKLQKGDSVKKVRKRKLKKQTTEPKIDRRRKPFLNDDLNETLFSITDLTFEEQVAEILKRQDSANYKNAVFKCTECFKGFLDEDAYSGHMSRHTKDCGEFRCDICKTHFKHPHALRKHITAHHTQRFSCNQCPYVTTHRQTARLHERWHKGTKYQCPHCPDEFLKFTTYMGHIRIKHPSDFVCQLCGYSFVSEKGIELHKKLKHRLDNDEIPPDGPYCAECGVRFVSVDAHAQHMRVSARHNHTDKEQRESNKPKKGRKSKEAKEREKRAREKNEKDLGESRRVFPSQMRKAEGPIPCEQCGMQLEDSRAYHGHFRRMHPDKNRTNYPSMKSPCMCEVCGRMFQSYALLKDHTWTHTGEKPFKCNECDKSFRMKQRLVAHRRVHQQVKASYLCNLCGKHFSTHSNRQRHMFIHTGLKPFKCEMCGKCFKHASEKRAHITYVHLKKPWPKRSRGKRRVDNRQGPVPTGASEMDVVQPLWAPCDPKLDHINNIIEDKPLYYNLKI